MSSVYAYTCAEQKPSFLWWVHFTHKFRLKICRGFITLKTYIAKKIEYRKFYSAYSIRGNSTHLKSASNSDEELWQKHWFSWCYSVEIFWKVWETDDKGVWDAILNKIYHTETFTYLHFNKIKGYVLLSIIVWTLICLGRRLCNIY